MVAASFLHAACGTNTGVSSSVSASAESAGLIDITSVTTLVDLDIRYAGHENFIGEPIDGYEAPKCLLHEAAAKRLAQVAAVALHDGYRLRLYDCYRPQRAVDHFVRWAADDSDQRRKREYYPDIAKAELIGPYIAAKSGHSRGATVDLTLLRQLDGEDWVEVDMGSPYDFFDPVSNTFDPRTTAMQRQNRLRLRAMMQAAGFAPYDLEWWHFTLTPEPYPGTYFDIPIR